MKVCLMLFLFCCLAKVDLMSTTQNSTDCQEETCGKGNGMVFRCEYQCDSNMTEISFTCPSSIETLSAVTATFAPTTATNISTQITTVPTTVNTTVEPMATSVSPTNATAGITYVYCVHCPQMCTECTFNSTTDSKACTKCKTGYDLNDIFQCIQKKKEGNSSSDNTTAIVVGCVCGGLAIVIAAVVIVCLVQRRRRNKADVSGQCQLRVVSSDQLNDDKPKGLHSVSAISDLGELDKLPMAPSPPQVGYDRLGIAESEELNYEPFDPSATQQNSKSESAKASNGEDIYVNVKAIKSNSSNTERSASPKPLITNSNDSGSTSLQMDNVYGNLIDEPKQPQNSHFPGSGLNDSEASLEMDDIYINENEEEVRRPSASKPKRPPMKVEKADQEPVSLEQENIYYNDPAQGFPSGPDQLYEVPEGGAIPSRQSDIYINASPDLVYQNMN